MTIEVPDFCLVMMVGGAYSGKSTMARRLFQSEEVVSWEVCRQTVAEDIEPDNSSDELAQQLLEDLVATRLQRRRLTVVDAPNLTKGQRASLKSIAKAYDAHRAAVVLETPLGICLERQKALGQNSGPAALREVRTEHAMLRQALDVVDRERFESVHRLDVEQQRSATLARRPLPCDRRHLRGPFDIIGDVHGCALELRILLKKLGHGDPYTSTSRRLVFLGDLTDRGPYNLFCYETVAQLVLEGRALCVRGNHDAKLLRYLERAKVTLTNGMSRTIGELEGKDDTYRESMEQFLGGLGHHYVLDEGRLVVAHGGLKETYHNRVSGRISSFCLYGDTNGQVDETGFPIRRDWDLDYRGEARVVYGHTPVTRPVWVNNTLNIDTGCVFGGGLTALRYPEMELVTVPALQTYWTPKRPLKEPVEESESGSTN